MLCLDLLIWNFVIYLSFGFLYGDVDWYMSGRVCHVVFYQCDEAPSCFVALSCCVVVELRWFVCFLKFCFMYILCWSRTCSSSDLRLRVLFMLNCRMFRLFALFVGLLLCCLWVVIRCGVVWCACMWWLTLECIECLVHVLSSWCFVCVVLLGALWMLHFHVSEYSLMLVLLHFMCVQCVGVMLQWIDPWERVMFLLHEGHMYSVCGPGLHYVLRQCDQC